MQLVASYRNTERGIRDKTVMRILARAKEIEATARRSAELIEARALSTLRAAEQRAERILGNAGLRPDESRVPTIDLLKSVAEKTGVSIDDMKGARRDRKVVAARHAAIAAIYESRPDLSLPQIGRIFGGRDHTTIIHAVRKMGASRTKTGA